MLDIKQLRTDPDGVRAALAKRGADVDLAPILKLDEEVRALTLRIDTVQAERNAIAKQMGQTKGKPDPESIAKASALKAEAADLQAQQGVTRGQFDEAMAGLPNLPDARVPEGGKEANQVIRSWGEKPKLGDKPLSHLELIEKHGLVDFERGVKMAGSNFWLYTGDGAALEWSLLDWFNRSHHRDGYTFFLPPHLLLPESGYGAGQFPKFYDDVFHIQVKEGGQERFLLPTAETALLNIYRDEIVPAEKLPIKAFAYTPCYRREGGGARADERGTVRGHQFNKVEMFQFVDEHQGEAALEELLGRAESLLQQLGLHYRTVLLAAGDVSASMAVTYDVEVWIPSIGDYKEISSVSWAKDYQARRARIRTKGKDEKQTRFLHTLNGSGLATSRLFPAILEQHQQPDGSVLIPEPLRAWMGKDRIG